VWELNDDAVAFTAEARECESAPNRDPRSQLELLRCFDANNRRFGGVPIGADRDLPVQRILDVESRWLPALERGPDSMLIHNPAAIRADSGNPRP
jgi:hypothetical protein